MRTEPAPAEDQSKADELYDRADYFAGAEIDPGLWTQMQFPIVADIQKIKSHGRLLDVGCGMGFLVKHARDKGFEAMGIDLNPHAVEWGRKHLAVPIEVKDLSTIENQSVDIIVANHVIEHVSQPKEFLALLRSKLRPDGILVVAVPNILGGVPRFLRLLNFLPFGPGANWLWFGYQFKQHFWHFTPQALSELLEREGWKMQSLRTDENMVYGAVALPTFKYRVMRILWKWLASMAAGDNLRVIVRP